jgi:hypothetical protein
MSADQTKNQMKRKMVRLHEKPELRWEVWDGLGGEQTQQKFWFALAKPSCLFLFPAASLGSLEGVDLRSHTLGLHLHVSREIAVAGSPFHGGVGIAVAIPTGRDINDPLATVTLIGDGMARTSIESTACFCHEGTLAARLHRCTNHGAFLQFAACFKVINIYWCLWEKLWNDN